MSLNYISVEQLTSIYNQDDGDNDNDFEFKLNEIVIIDVRDDDYISGNIKGNVISIYLYLSLYINV
jgi:hypothetical protein